MPGPRRLTTGDRGRIDTAAIRRCHPLRDTIERYGVALGRGGRPMGRCPFHRDREPSLALYLDDPADEHFHCFGCGAHGDVIRFVELIERLPFMAAVAALAAGGGATAIEPPTRRPTAGGRQPITLRASPDRACLAAAIAHYHRRLFREPAALAYCAERGLDRDTLSRHRIGFAPARGDGNELVAALAREGFAPARARRAGLTDPQGREFLAGRIIIPELRADGPIWAIGRRLAGAGPRYLGLPGSKPLLGLAEARGERAIYLTEGPFDRLTLSRWGLPAIALAGIGATPGALSELARFPRIYLVMDTDNAGREATTRLTGALGCRALPISLPGVKDVADLGRRPGGELTFRRAVERAEREHESRGRWAA